MPIYLSKKELLKIEDVIESAERSITDRLGVSVRIIIHRATSKEIEKEVVAYFEEVCLCWGKSLSWVSESGRDLGRPDMKKLLWMIGRLRFSHLSYATLGRLTGVSDHASVLKGAKAGYNLIKISDPKFLTYYEPVKKYLKGDEQ